MTHQAFSPTHTVPPTGLPSWDEPDPSRPPDGRLDPGLAVEVLGEQGEWAQVRCSNDWQSWVNHAALVVGATVPVATSPIAAPYVSPPAPDYFTPTHQIPAGGLEARAQPDAAEPMAAWVNEGLAVQVVGQANGWCNVRFDNGWEAWVDGSRLVPWGIPLVGTGRSVANPVAVWLPIGGALLVVLGALLPWFSVVESANAFDIPFAVLFDKTSTATAPDLGWFLLPVVLVAAAPVLGAALPRPLLGVLGALPIVIVVLFLRLYSSFPSPRPDLGAGLFLTLLGGALIAGAAVVPSGRE